MHTYTTKTNQITFLQPESPKSFIAETRERIQYHGKAALSNHEILSLVIGNALGAAQIRETYGQNLRPLTNVGVDQLSRLGGIGRATACRLIAAIELGYRMAQEEKAPTTQITSPTEAANFIMLEMRDLTQEHLRVLVLNTRNRVLAQHTIYIGNVNTSIIRVAEILRPAIEHNAPTIIVAHNHPSGDPTPSPEDVHVTKKIIEAGELLDIEVLDHLIIGDNRYISLKERGLI